MKKAIIIGASSGIGRELSKILSRNGYIIGLVARRITLLKELQDELENKSYIKHIDISKPIETKELLNDLIEEMGSVDLIIISSGVGYLSKNFNWKQEKQSIDVNITGFTIVSNIAFEYFIKQNSGHIVGISSIAGLRGSRDGTCYNACKAYISNYLEGLRQRANKLGRQITITDIKPGLVDTDMAKGEGLFWVASSQKAAQQMYIAITKKKNNVYITRRWCIIAWILKLIPSWIYCRL